MRQADDLSDDVGLRAAYAAHGPELYRFVLRGLGDPHLAQDAVQETFLRAWQAAHRYDPALASLRVWLFSIARNVVLDVHRRRSRPSWAHAMEQEGLEARLDPASDATEPVLVRAVVGAALGELSPEHREVIVETYLRGRSYDELAADTGVAPGTLRSRMFYALKALRTTMKAMGVE